MGIESGQGHGRASQVKASEWSNFVWRGDFTRETHPCHLLAQFMPADLASGATPPYPGKTPVVEGH